MKSSVKKVNQVAKAALVEVVELKKADVAVASAGVDRLAAARAAAALKRQKKAAALDARAKGKIAAAEAREKEAERVETAAEKEREDLLARIARTRKAMGIRKNEENPAALRRLIEQWEMEARMRIYNRGEGPKQVEPSMGA
jgi:single-stranded DNA-specific DHH superfamily exonuclease